MMRHVAAVFIVASGAAHAQGSSLGPGPFPVYNQAYQENYEPDALPDILAEAHSAYVLLDPFSGPPEDWFRAVAALRGRGNAVGAYISIGTGEDWRADFAALKPFLVTKPWDQWAGEYFVTDTAGALPVMKARIDRIAAWGFDWVEFDNMDWANDDTSRETYGFAVSAQDSAAYYRALCDHVHARGMSCMAKNIVEGADNFDGVLYESYAHDPEWWDRDGGLSFAAAQKPVIVVHYAETDCARVDADYRAIYGPTLSFLCEDTVKQAYVRLTPQGSANSTIRP